MKTVWLKTDGWGGIVWHLVFLDFAHYWYSVPWSCCRVWVRDHQGQIEVRCGDRRIAVHAPASGKHQTLTIA